MSGIRLGLGLPESTAELAYCGEELQLCGPLLVYCLRRYLPRNVLEVIVHLALTWHEPAGRGCCSPLQVSDFLSLSFLFFFGERKG